MFSAIVVFCEVTCILSCYSTKMFARSRPLIFCLAHLFNRKSSCKPFCQSVVALRRPKLLSGRWVDNHKIVIKYCVGAFLPMGGKERHNRWSPIILKRLVLKWHLNLVHSDLFFCLLVELVTQLVWLVQIADLYLLVCLFLRKYAIYNRTFRAVLDLYVAFRIHVVAFNVQTRVDINRSKGFAVLVLGH